MVKSRRAGHVAAWGFVMEDSSTFSSRQTADEAAGPSAGAERTRHSMPARLMMAMYPTARRGRWLSRRRVLPSLQSLPEETDADQDAKSTRAAALEDTALAAKFGQLTVSDACKASLREGGQRSCKLPPRPRSSKSKQSFKRRLFCPVRRLRDQYVSCMWDIDGMADVSAAVSGPHAVIYAAQETRHPAYID